MFVHNIDPVLFRIGPLQIKYYGLVYAIGFLLAMYILLHYTKKHRIKNLDEEGVYDYMLYLIAGSILISRLFYELVYNYKEFFSSPATFFYFWQGGMSFHGGLIGGILATLYFCKKRKVGFYEIADIIVLPMSLMLGIGRIANFINAELVGTVTNVPWCVDFGDGLCRHPSQLYEAAKNFLIFGVLMSMRSLKLRKGTLFWSFAGLYGLLRFIITFWRVQDYFVLGLGIGQWLSLLMVPISAFMIYRIYKIEKDTNFRTV